MIKPSVGRIIWYNPAPNEPIYSERQVLAAIIAGVNFTGTINIAVFAADGSGPHARQDVPIFDGESAPIPAACCVWMPYQKGQAAKTEAAESLAAQSAP